MNLRDQILSVLLTSFPPSAPVPSRHDVEERLEGICTLLQQMLDDKEKEQILRKALEIIPIDQAFGGALSDADEYPADSAHWYTTRKEVLQKRSLAYFAALRGKHWSPRVIATIDSDSDKIMDLLGNPEMPEFDIRGLIMGDVQSGKTANFIALCNKAADAGYRVIIITTGIIEKLRQQTQRRLMAEFVNLCPQVQIPVLTTPENDFDAGAGQVFNQTPMQVFRTDVPVLCVVKKNSPVLRNLLAWLKRGRNGEKLQYPLLFIDDEADNASVNTNDPDGDKPSVINGLIRQILDNFAKSSYVGITATPFANVFINPDIREDQVAQQDLFPKSFVYRIEPASSYFGSDRLFQEGSPFLKAIDDLETWLPAKHTREYPVQGNQMPLSLKCAVATFLLRNYVCHMGALGDDAPTHRSMLIHISRFIPIQNKVKEFVNDYVHNGLARALRLYGGDATARNSNEHLCFLHEVWQLESIEERYCLKWEKAVRSGELLKSIARVEVISVNSQRTDPLDYDAHEDDGGLQVIVVGGNALARGLTLEGLIVSYFRRNTKMADTLLQMSRWLGHRSGYEDLVSVWLEPGAKTDFGFAMAVSDEMSDMFHQMQREHRRPTEFAIKIRRYPGAFLPTARNKMRTSDTAEFPYELSGYALETPRLPNKRSDLEENESLVREFIASMRGTQTHRGDWPNAIFFEGISTAKIGDFLSRFHSRALNYGFEIQQVAKCVANTQDPWDVLLLNAFPTDTGNCVNVGTPEAPLFLQSSQRKLDVKDETIQISGTKLKVAPGSIMKHGLTRLEGDEVLEAFRVEKGNPQAEAPDSRYLAHMKTSMLVIQHIICSTSKDEEKLEKRDFFALSLGFCGDRRGPVTMSYHMTKNAMRFYQESLNDNGDT